MGTTIWESESKRSELEKNIADCSAKNLAMEAKKKEIMVLLNMHLYPYTTNPYPFLCSAKKPNSRKVLQSILRRTLNCPRL